MSPRIRPFGRLLGGELPTARKKESTLLCGTNNKKQGVPRESGPVPTQQRRRRPTVQGLLRAAVRIHAESFKTWTSTRIRKKQFATTTGALLLRKSHHGTVRKNTRDPTRKKYNASHLAGVQEPAGPARSARPKQCLFSTHENEPENKSPQRRDTNTRTPLTRARRTQRACAFARENQSHVSPAPPSACNQNDEESCSIYNTNRPRHSTVRPWRINFPLEA